MLFGHFVECPLVWACLMFHQEWTEGVYFGKNPTEVMLCPVQYLLLGVHGVCVISLVMLTLVLGGGACGASAL